MRYHLSVFALCVRTKIYKLLLTLALMVAASVAVFSTLGYANAWNYGADTPGMLILGGIFAASCLATALICVGSGGRRAKPALTLWRLQISERWVFFWDALAAVGCFLALYAAQILTIFVLAVLYQRSADYALGEQGIYVMLARCSLTHGLLPFGEGTLWTRNLIYLLCMGVSAAAGRVAQRNGRRVTATAFCLVFAATRVPTALGNGFTSLLWLVVVLIAGGVAVVSALDSAHPGKRRRDEDA